MNNKGVAQLGIFIFFLIGILIFMFASGSIAGLMLKGTMSNIPLWFWIALVIFIIIAFGRKKR